MASKYRKKFTMPENFYKVLEDYSREVLRDQPRDILEFSYLYFKALEEVSKLVSNNILQMAIYACAINKRYANILIIIIILGNFRLV